MVDRDVAADVRLGRKEQRDYASCKSSPRHQRLQEIASLTYRDGGAWTSSLSREGALFDPSPESRAVLFLIGDHELHPDVNVNFQMSPSMAGSVFHGVIMS